ncbi:hypothetical protein [Candidatus Leptofilum sp.]|uniref:hypothetical protein n=1 Tax=Candidatus Leptofilum sp. TaxID=3241576 RepID=UPI003B5C75FC
MQEEELAIWQEIEKTAVSAGLDPTKFTDTHREIVAQIVTFLQTPQAPPPEQKPASWVKWLPLGKNGNGKRPSAPPPTPLIICGEPGTGKTTFLNVLDVVLRQVFELPDNIQPVMNKGKHEYFVTKRLLNGRPISLLSVKKWDDLLHFYTWSRETHGLVEADRTRFVQETLLPMRIIFADEVEMTGYSPTLPILAQHGLLVIGTSNQSRFAQLEERQVPPYIYTFAGIDLRAGSPADAVVQPDDPAWIIFDQLQASPVAQYEQLAYQMQKMGDVLFVRLDFDTAVRAPLLENEWANFLQTLPRQPDMPLIFLLDDFSLQSLRTDYNAIIRFVSLFDLIEQQGIGVLVRNRVNQAELSREALSHMKVTIHAARSVPEAIKVKTAVGIDRATSRIGQAGHKAHQYLPT